MNDGKILVEKLLRYAEKFLELNPRDEVYFRNLLLKEFKLSEPATEVGDLSFIDSLDVPDVLVEELEKFAVGSGLCEDGLQNLYSTYVMGLLSPLPSQVNQRFIALKNKKGIQVACDYLHDLGVKNNYIQKTAIGRNMKWEYIDGEKYLEITINLSKPEKDNKEVAKLLKAPKKSNYPACFLCKENEGFEGTATHPARENLRTVSLTMGGEPWFVQYSPYAYYDQHMIAISEAHVPMHVEGDTIDKLLDFVDFFPNYMVGSNAALPIIGGSILNHEHFQGGGHLMPMHNAPLSKFLHGFVSKKHRQVKVGVVDWYNSVVRLESKNRKQIASLAKIIVKSWADFSDVDCNIVAVSNGARHNSLAPVCRKHGKVYVFDLILRNNLTNKEYPDGIFHAHPEYHNIKKEGIGLIEAMGLFILPGRLKKQLSDVADIVAGKVNYCEEELFKEDHPLYVHRNMIKELVAKGVTKNIPDAQKRVTEYVNVVCKNILDNTAVFKKDENGWKGFIRFLESAGLKQII